MDLVSIAQRLRAVYESIEDLIGSDERYEIEDILEEMEQEIIHDDKKTFQIGDDEEG